MAWRVFLSLFLVPCAAGENNTRCFECIDLPLPLYCTRATVCAHGQKCVVEELITSGGLTLYNSGCLSEQRCSLAGLVGRRSMSRYTPLSRRADAIVCVECCDEDFCNHQGCGVVRKKQPNRGPLCFQCDHEETPNNCRNVVQCNLGEVCMLTELQIRSSDGNTLYKTSCKPAAECEAKLSSLFGKRRAAPCHTCCTDDFCNDKCQLHSNIPMTSSTAIMSSTSESTTSTTLSTAAVHITTTLKPQMTTPRLSDICHQRNYTYNARSNLCYHFHFKNQIWKDANNQCIQEGGHLAVVDTEAKWNVLKHEIDRQYDNCCRRQTAQGAKDDHHDSVHLGASDTGHSDNDFHWTTGGKLRFNDWDRHEPDGGSQDCVYASGSDHWRWHDSHCSSKRLYVCTIDLD